MPEEISQKKAYVIQFWRSLRHWRAKNLPDHGCIAQARQSAKGLYPLTEEEQQEVDAFLEKELKLKNAWQSMGASNAIRVDFEAEEEGAS